MKLIRLYIYVWATFCLFSILFFADNTVFAQAISMSRVASSNANLGSPVTLKIEKDITIETWVNPGSPAIGSEAINTIIGNKGNGLATAGFALFINSYSFSTNDGRIHFETQGKSVYTLSNAVTPGVWQHIAVSVVGATQTVNIYVNGVLQTNDLTNPNNGVNVTETALSLRIGSFGNGLFPFIGSMDELRVWNKALSQAEIMAKMNKTLSGQDCNLIGYWNFNEGAGTTVADATIAANNGTLAGTYAWVASGANLSGGALPPPMGPCLSTWNGTAWSDGKPTANTTATFAGNYSTATEGNTLVAKEVIINTGNALTMGAAANVRVFTNLTINGGLANCLSGTLNVTGTTTGTVSGAVAQPTTEANAISFSGVTTNSFTINWANGNGAKRVVVVKPAVTVAGAALTDNTIYTADTDFGGAGSVVDGTGKVVYNGNVGTSVIVTGLTSGVTYHVAVFEYNENLCGQNYKTGSPAKSSQLVAANVTIWNGTTWDNGVPNSNIFNATINGNFNTAINGNITANTLAVNAGFTLTVGAAATINITNALTSNGTISNCDNGTITNGSLVGNPIQGLVAEPTTAATGVNFTGITATGFTINWANGNGTNRIVVVKPNATVNGTAIVDKTAYTANANFSGGGSVVDGTGQVVYNGNVGNSVIVTGLLAGITYHVAVFEYNTGVPCGANYKTDVFAAGVQASLPSAPVALIARNITPFSFIADNPLTQTS